MFCSPLPSPRWGTGTPSGCRGQGGAWGTWGSIAARWHPPLSVGERLPVTLCDLTYAARAVHVLGSDASCLTRTLVPCDGGGPQGAALPPALTSALGSSGPGVLADLEEPRVTKVVARAGPRSQARPAFIPYVTQHPPPEHMHSQRNA